MTATSSGTTRVKRGLVWSATNSVFLRLGNLAMAMVIARLLTPEQFGAFAVALTVQLVLGTLAEFGLGADLISSKDMERRAPTIATAALATAVVLGGTMALAAPAIAEAFSSPEAAGPLALMSVSVVMSGLSVVPAAVLQRDFQQGKAFAADGAGVVVSVVVTVPIEALRVS